MSDKQALLREKSRAEIDRWLAKWYDPSREKVMAWEPVVQMLLTARDSLSAQPAEPKQPVAWTQDDLREHARYTLTKYGHYFPEACCLCRAIVAAPPAQTVPREPDTPEYRGPGCCLGPK